MSVVASFSILIISLSYHSYYTVGLFLHVVASSTAGSAQCSVLVAVWQACRTISAGRLSLPTRLSSTSVTLDLAGPCCALTFACQRRRAATMMLRRPPFLLRCQ